METLFRVVELAPGVRGIAGLTDGAPIVVGVESPRSGDLVVGSTFRLKGWFFARSSRVVRLFIVGLAGTDREIPLVLARPDVRASAQQLDATVELPESCGFDVCFTAPAKGQFELSVRAMLDGGEPQTIATINGELLHAPAAAARRLGAGGILAAGFHRSGSSLLAEVLSASGLDLGNELVPPELSNPRGHFEDCWAVEINSSMLRAVGRGWQVRDASGLTASSEHLRVLRHYVERRSTDVAAWAVKDPRAGLFARAWREVAPELKIVASVRGPDQCATSMRRRQAREVLRDPFATDAAMLNLWSNADLPHELWCAHYESLQTCEAPGLPPITYVEHGELLSNPPDVVRSLIGSGANLSYDPVRAELIQVAAARWSPTISPQTVDRIRPLIMHMRLHSVEVPNSDSSTSAPREEGEIWSRVSEFVDRLGFRGSVRKAEVTSAAAPRDILEVGRRAMQEQRWLDAAAIFSEAWVEPQWRADLSHMHAELLMKIGRWSDALSIFSGLTSSSSDSKALAAAAECLLLLGHFDDAADTVRQLIATRPTEPWPWQHAARIVTRLNDARLHKMFAQALEASVNRSDADWVAVQALWEMRRGHLQEGSSLLNQLVQSEPGAKSDLLWQAVVERELRSGRIASARTKWVENFLEKHEATEYLEQLRTVVESLDSREMRIDLLLHLESEFARLVSVNY